MEELLQSKTQRSFRSCVNEVVKSVPLVTGLCISSPVSLMWPQKHRQCDISSKDIELQYQQDPSAIVTFSTKSFSYELDLSGELQTRASVSLSSFFCSCLTEGSSQTSSR